MKVKTQFLPCENYHTHTQTNTHSLNLHVPKYRTLCKLYCAKKRYDKKKKAAHFFLRAFLPQLVRLQNFVRKVTCHIIFIKKHNFYHTLRKVRIFDNQKMCKNCFVDKYNIGTYTYFYSIKLDVNILQTNAIPI